MECNRCFQETIVDEIGSKLAIFVCSSCRNDNIEWHFKEKKESREHDTILPEWDNTAEKLK